MGSLKVGVIGVGNWGCNHARVYSELVETELVAICDVNEQRARSVAQRYGTRCYTSLDEFLSRSGVEAVSVVTPIRLLSEVAEKALESGKHVLVEKPMALKVEDAERLIEIADRNGLHLQVGFIMRFHPVVQSAKAAISKKRLGDLLCVDSKRLSKRPDYMRDTGVTFDLAIHDIDVLRYLTRQEVRRVYAKAYFLNGVDESVEAMLELEGATAVVEANGLTPKKVRLLSVTGTEGYLSGDYEKMSLKLYKEDAEYDLVRLPAEEPLKLELRNFARSCMGREDPLSLIHI